MFWAKAIPFQGFWAFVTTLSTKIEKQNKQKKPQQKQHKNSLFHIFDFGAPYKGHVTPKNMFGKVIDSKVLLNFVQDLTEDVIKKVLILQKS